MLSNGMRPRLLVVYYRRRRRLCREMQQVKATYYRRRRLRRELQQVKAIWQSQIQTLRRRLLVTLTKLMPSLELQGQET